MVVVGKVCVVAMVVLGGGFVVGGTAVGVLVALAKQCS